MRRPNELSVLILLWKLSDRNPNKWFRSKALLPYLTRKTGWSKRYARETIRIFTRHLKKKGWIATRDKRSEWRITQAGIDFVDDQLFRWK